MKNYEVKKFKDGQVACRILDEGNLYIETHGNTYEDLFKVASIKEAWDYKNRFDKTTTSTLFLYCLIGQRSDRRFGENESFDLKVIANFINSMGFDEVKIFHPHSDISLALINHAVAIKPFEFIKKAYDACGSPLLISPDAGAYKNLHEVAEKLNADLIPSNKVRVNGVPKVLFQGEVKGRECLIVDDIADGGRTFIQLAKSLKEQGATKVYLYVSHAQFNYGFDEIWTQIDKVFCTNSYREINEEKVIQYLMKE